MNTLKNKDLANLQRTFEALSNVKGKKFAYAIFKNKALIEAEMKILEQLKRQPHPDFWNYENERIAVCNECSEKDNNGNPVIEDNKFKIIDQNVFTQKLIELQTKYKEVMEDMQNAEKEYSDFMEKDAAIELVKINIDDLPDDIDAKLLESLKYILNE